jgi:hypothetical protein
MSFDALSALPFRLRPASGACIKPIRESRYGLTFSDEEKRARWIEDIAREAGN